jgi:hypothetical protein
MQRGAQPRLELELTGLQLQADTFPASGSYVRRGALR